MTTAPPPKKPDVTAWPRWDRMPDADRKALKASAGAGIAITILFHVFIIAALPEIQVSEVQPQEENLPLEVELVEPPPPEQFVETNPNVPEEVPEETQNFAAQDQVAAQLEAEPDAEQADAPQVEGELEDSNKVVTGELTEQPSVPVPQGMPDMPQPEVQEQTQEAIAEEVVQEQIETPEPETVQQPVPEPDTGEETEAPQEPAPEMIEQEALQEEGIPSIEKAGEAEEIPEKPEEEEVIPAPAPRPEREVSVMMEEVRPSQQTAPGQPVPQARPRINFRVPPGPRMINPVSTNRVGVMSIDANFSEFGAYQQRMMEAISAQWTLMARNANFTGSQRGTMVHVRYTLKRDGHVEGFQILRSSASRPATYLVQDAVLSRAPFGDWTREMVATLGDEQSIEIRFFYQ